MDKQGGCSEQTENSRADRGRLRRRPPDHERTAFRRSGNRGDRYRLGPVRGRRPDQRAGAGRHHPGHRDAAHGRTDVPAKNHEPAPDTRGDLFEPGGGRSAERSEGAGVRRRGDHRQAAPRHQTIFGGIAGADLRSSEGGGLGARERSAAEPRFRFAWFSRRPCRFW